MIAHLPRIRDMGFDVLYFPPIHPIGTQEPQGPQQQPDAGAGRSRQPLCHRRGRRAGTTRCIPSSARSRISAGWCRPPREHGLEIALDFAIQCSPDHPWLKRASRTGSTGGRTARISYAENPPKKYEDIVNVDFYAEGAVPGLWLALRDVVLFWVGQGVRIFRVDNPHTKPLPFWEWMIADVRGRHPDAIFLAEAFTRPKMMYRLAKVGFSQSYTYFTWRNTKQELDRLPDRADDDGAAGLLPAALLRQHAGHQSRFLQSSGRAGFLIRAALAATLSGLWGVYSGFELCEAARAARARGISRLARSTRSAPGTSTRPATSSPRSRGSTASARPIRRCRAISACASTTPSTTRSWSTARRRRTARNMMLVARQPRSAQRAGGRLRDPAVGMGAAATTPRSRSRT